MVKIIVFCAFLATVCAAAPQELKNVAHIVNQESSVDADGKYHYSFESSDGTKAGQAGELIQIGNDAGQTSKGYYEYKYGNEVIRVDYTAGPNGFVAVGPHIPVVPDSIVRALKWIQEHPYKEPTRKL